MGKSPDGLLRVRRGIQDQRHGHRRYLAPAFRREGGRQMAIWRQLAGNSIKKVFLRSAEISTISARIRDFDARQ
jgi:hypothetical protein